MSLVQHLQLPSTELMTSALAQASLCDTTACDALQDLTAATVATALYRSAQPT